MLVDDTIYMMVLLTVAAPLSSEKFHKAIKKQLKQVSTSIIANYNQKSNILEVGDETCNKMLAILM